jgi:hypothetical protein
MLALAIAVGVASVALFNTGAIEKEAWWFLGLLAMFVAFSWKKPPTE